MASNLATVTQRCLIDLHLHLDGSISVPMARRLAELDGRVMVQTYESSNVAIRAAR